MTNDSSFGIGGIQYTAITTKIECGERSRMGMDLSDRGELSDERKGG